MPGEFLSHQGKLRRIIEEDGVMLISFTDHESYFTVTDVSVYSLLRDSMMTGQDVIIYYNPEMQVVSVH
jgi:hypothetical protein